MVVFVILGQSTQDQTVSRAEHFDDDSRGHGSALDLICDSGKCCLYALIYGILRPLGTRLLLHGGFGRLS